MGISVTFNPGPTKQAVEVLFSQQKRDSNHPPLFFNGSIVLKVDDNKHLGLTLDSKLSFVNHINDKIKIAIKRSLPSNTMSYFVTRLDI